MKLISFVALLLGLSLILWGGVLEMGPNHLDLAPLLGFVLIHLGTAFIVSVCVFWGYELSKSKFEFNKLVASILSLFVSDGIRQSLISIINNTDFIKVDYKIYYKIFLDKTKKSITSYEKIVQYKLKNTTDREKLFPIRVGFDKDYSELKTCKVNGSEVKMNKDSSPKKKMGENTVEFFNEVKIDPGETVTVCLLYKTKCQLKNLLDSPSYTLTPAEKTIVSIDVPDTIDKYDLDIFAIASDDFVRDKNTIHKNHATYVLNSCLLPYQGFQLKMSHK